MSSDKTLTASEAGKRGGRPTIYDEPKERKTVTAAPHHWQHLKEKYGGFSQGIQALAERDMAAGNDASS